MMKYERQEQLLDKFIVDGGNLGVLDLDGEIVFVAHSRGFVKTSTGSYYKFMIGHDGSWWFKPY